MIAYLVYSSLSLGLLFLLYYFFLEKEKRFTFNRVYLLWSLIFSITIPLIPVGMAQADLPWSNLQAASAAETSISYSLVEGFWLNSPAETASADQRDQTTNTSLFILLLIYLAISLLLFVRLIRITHMIQMKIRRNPKRLTDGCELVLVNEEVVPHTFLKSVFINRKQYEKGEIPEEVLIHESTHARQNHTLDILFVEFLKVIFWFNPLLYIYKRSIALNHEYLADEAVISKGTAVCEYQKLLLSTIQGRMLHGLVSTFNYTLTKRRLQMMTKSKSTMNFALKSALLLPLFAGMTLILGCESTSTEQSEEGEIAKVIEVEITETDALIVDGEVMSLDEFDSYLSERSKKPEHVNFKVDGNATFGFITDVQKVLREQGAFRINYSAKATDEAESLEEVTNRYVKATEVYMRIDPKEVTREELQQEYENVVEFFDAILNAEISQPDSPPPPPMVPTPEQRLDRAKNEQDQAAIKSSTPAPVEPRNLLSILMNRQGMMLMNEEPVEMNEIKNRITQFLGNKGNNPNLSDDPKDAIISISTASDTPYDLYKELLDRVMEAYNELSNEASVEKFGAQFSELAEGSDMQSEIQEYYPMRIFLAPPDEK
ncbi:hypothetical protein BH23BAC3_BH23BAC3_31530 [soil metagenome]